MISSGLKALDGFNPISSITSSLVTTISCMNGERNMVVFSFNELSRKLTIKCIRLLEFLLGSSFSDF